MRMTLCLEATTECLPKNRRTPLGIVVCFCDLQRDNMVTFALIMQVFTISDTLCYFPCMHEPQYMVMDFA